VEHYFTASMTAHSICI